MLDCGNRMSFVCLFHREVVHSSASHVITLYKGRRYWEEYVPRLCWRPVCFVHWMHVDRHKTESWVKRYVARCASNVTRLHVNGFVWYSCLNPTFSLSVYSHGHFSFESPIKSPIFWAGQLLKDRSSTAVGKIKPKSLAYNHPLRLNVQRHNKQVFLPEKNWAGRCGLVTSKQERSRPLAGSRVRGHRPWLFPETRNTDGKKDASLCWKCILEKSNTWAVGKARKQSLKKQMIFASCL